MNAPMIRRPTHAGHPFDRMFEHMLGDWCGPDGTCNEMTTFSPSLDVHETDKDIVVAVEVPGMEPKDLQVSFEQNVLTISGEKRSEERKKEDRLHRVERRYGRFVRKVEFGSAVDGDRIEAAFRNGVLTVTLPKTAKARARTIDVKA